MKARLIACSTRRNSVCMDPLSHVSIVASFGLGVNQSLDAVYSTSEMDADSKPYHGTNKYVRNFPKSRLPPVNVPSGH